jgi:hypothetical protein
MSDAKNFAYPYAPIAEGIGKGLMVYTGNPIELEEGEDLPENSSKWKPVVNTEGHVAYFHSAGYWISAPDITKIDLALVRNAMLRRITDDFNYDVSQLSAQYPAGEQQSWTQQLAEAQALTANADAPTPLLTVLAIGRDTTVKELAQKIIEKSTAYHAALAEKIASYQKQRTAIDSATSTDQLPAVSLADLDYMQIVQS